MESCWNTGPQIYKERVHRHPVGPDQQSITKLSEWFRFPRRTSLGWLRTKVFEKERVPIDFRLHTWCGIESCAANKAARTVLQIEGQSTSFSMLILASSSHKRPSAIFVLPDGYFRVGCRKSGKVGRSWSFWMDELVRCTNKLLRCCGLVEYGWTAKRANPSCMCACSHVNIDWVNSCSVIVFFVYIVLYPHGYNPSHRTGRNLKRERCWCILSWLRC